MPPLGLLLLVGKCMYDSHLLQSLTPSCCGDQQQGVVRLQEEI